MKIIPLILLFLCMAGNGYCEEWSLTNPDRWTTNQKITQAVIIGMQVVDWGQTRNIAGHPNDWHEINPILGAHPSKSKVDMFFISGILLRIGLVHIVPSKYRPYIQMFQIGGSAFCINKNINTGIQIKF